MLKLLGYLIKNGVVTSDAVPEFLHEDAFGLPALTDAVCDDGCRSCVDLCPTEAIVKDDSSLTLDQGACIACRICVQSCQSAVIVDDRATATYARKRGDLRLHQPANSPPPRNEETAAKSNLYKRSLAVRVVSTGCSACDLEMSATTNPIFDIERFGISVVASPRFADALLITGPVPKAMHQALRDCYEAMSGPKLVIACGTCAISGGVHAGNYTEANGVDAILPVDIYIPGCPPHPWQIIQGLRAAQNCL